MEKTRFSAIIPAAGSGKRVGQATPKQWIKLGDDPMLIHVLRKFENLQGVHKIAVALNPDNFEERKATIESYNLDLDLIFCHGGKRRQDSVSLALDALNVDDKEIITIHDAARPFVSRELILSVVKKADEGQAAIAAIPVVDTIKEVDRIGFVMNTPRRTFLRQAQTPQAVRAGILRRGLSLAALRDIELTDDAIAAELIGFRVSVVSGEENNIKITTAKDLAFVNYLLKKGELTL